MASNLPPGWAAMPPPEPKDLILHISDTLHRFLDHYHDLAAHEVEYAFIIDGGHQRLLLAVLNADQFPDEPVAPGQTVTLRGGPGDTGIEYEIIGTIEDRREIIMTCDDSRLKTFFAKDGRELLNDVRVQNLVHDRKVEGGWKGVEADVKKALKRDRQKKEAREACTDASSTTTTATTTTTDRSGIDPDAAERKREKRRRKAANQKHHRAERAEQLERREREQRKKMREIQKALDQDGLEGEFVDPTTEEGQKRIEEMVAKGAQLYTLPRGEQA